MSKHQSPLNLKENQLPKGTSPLTGEQISNMDEFVGQRVSLQTIQPSANSKGLVGSHGQIIHAKDQKSKTKSLNMPAKIQVFEDRNSNTVQKKNKVEEIGVQTDPGELEGFKPSTAGDIDVEYFSVMAERRRVALAEALEENEQLHREVDNLRSEVEALRAENSTLKPLAEEAEYLAGVLKGLLGESEEEVPDEATNANQSDS